MRNFGLLGLILLTQWGCQCCCVTEWYQDRIDCIADHKCNMDRCYRPCLDLTQIKRCGDNGCQGMVSQRHPNICEVKSASTTSSIAQVEDTLLSDPASPTIETAKPDDEVELVDKIRWVHFEPLPAIDTVTVKQQETSLIESTSVAQESEVEDVKIFEAPKPVFEPQMSAPLSVRPNPFLN